MIDQIQSHFDRILDSGRLNDNTMWWSSLDTRTGRYPADDTRPEHIPKRVYRNIDAPRGVSLYWDMPHLRAACLLSEHTGDIKYRNAAHDYIRAYLQHGIAAKGLLLWGNHYYYHADHDAIVMFESEEDPQPVNPSTHHGHLHEMRPLTPDWALLWEVDAEATENAIRAAGQYHIYDAATGGFNRHADQHKSYDFLEAGGILVESLAWLYTKTGDPSLWQQAARIASYSYAGRHPQTGLLRNSRDSKRWDYHTATTEVGLWVLCLLRAHRYTGDPDLLAMAAEAITAYLRCGFDETSDRLYGRLNVDDGQPQRSPKSTKYQPDFYSDPWNAVFPSHDYPLHFASACLELYTFTKNAHFGEAAARCCNGFVATAADSPPIRYAEHYGLHIAYFTRAAEVLAEPAYLKQADRFKQQALQDLYVNGMFRSHTGEHRYDAVDGAGILFQSLLTSV